MLLVLAPNILKKTNIFKKVTVKTILLGIFISTRIIGLTSCEKEAVNESDATSKEDDVEI